jgi:hypothetical protein
VIYIFQSKKKPLTAAELLEEIEKLSNHDPVPNAIYMTPLDDNRFKSNEDSGAEGCNDPNRLNPKQLQAQAETITEENRNNIEVNKVKECEENRKSHEKLIMGEKEKKVEIPQPNVVHCYNRFMGGVEQIDNNVSNYHILFRVKKWYIPISFWIFDVCLNNAWIVSRKFGKKN